MIIIDIRRVLEVFSVGLEIELETLLLALMYHVSGPLGTFTADFISLISELQMQHRILIASDFNLE